MPGVGQLAVAPPGPDQQFLEFGIGAVKHLAAAGISLAVEHPVIGFVDTVHALAGLSDHRGIVLAVGVHHVAEIGLNHIGQICLLAGVEPGDHGAHDIPFEFHFWKSGTATGGVFALFYAGEGGIEHVEEPAGGVEFEKRRAERNKNDIGGGKRVNGEIAQCRGRIEQDDVIILQRATLFQRPGKRIPERPAAQTHTPDRDLEFGPVEVQLRADQIDIRPVGFSEPRC